VEEVKVVQSFSDEIYFVLFLKFPENSWTKLIKINLTLLSY